MSQGEGVALVCSVKDGAQRRPATICQERYFGRFSSSVRRIPARYVSPEYVLHEARIYSDGASDGASRFHSFVKYILEYAGLRP